MLETSAIFCRSRDQLLEVRVAGGMATLSDADDIATSARASAPARGPGEALWWAQRYARRQVICVIDTAVAVPSAASLEALIGEDVRRPRQITVAGPRRTEESGWNGDCWLAAINEVTLRPVVNLHLPELASMGHLLSGCVLIRRQTLGVLPMSPDATWSFSLLVSVARSFGGNACASVDVDGMVPATPAASLVSVAMCSLGAWARGDASGTWADLIVDVVPGETGALLPPIAQLGA